MNETRILTEARVVPVGSKNLSRLSHTLGGSWAESLSSLCPLFPYLHVLPFFLIFLLCDLRHSPLTLAGLRTDGTCRVCFPRLGSKPRPNNPVTRSSSAIGQFVLVGVVHYSFVERNRSTHFGFAPTSFRPLRTAVPHSLFFR